MRHQTGLRNKFRSGRSRYSIGHKASVSDSYGAWSNGTQTRAERIAGHTLSYDVKSHHWTSSESVRAAIDARTERILHIPS